MSVLFFEFLIVETRYSQPFLLFTGPQDHGGGVQDSHPHWCGARARPFLFCSFLIASKIRCSQPSLFSIHRRPRSRRRGPRLSSPLARRTRSSVSFLSVPHSRDALFTSFSSIHRPPRSRRRGSRLSSPLARRTRSPLSFLFVPHSMY